MICPVCKREVDHLITSVKNGVYTSQRCERCVANIKAPAAFARKYERDRQREDYRKDIIQKDDPDFVKVYGAEAASKAGWSDQDIIKHA